jgi:hypothetical protein
MPSIRASLILSETYTHPGCRLSAMINDQKVVSMGISEPRHELVTALREAREKRAFQGIVYLRCDQPGYRVTAVEWRVHEGRDGVKRLQPKLACPLCQHALVCHDIRHS